MQGRLPFLPKIVLIIEPLRCRKATLLIKKFFCHVLEVRVSAALKRKSLQVGNNHCDFLTILYSFFVTPCSQILLKHIGSSSNLVTIYSCLFSEASILNG